VENSTTDVWLVFKRDDSTSVVYHDKKVTPQVFSDAMSNAEDVTHTSEHVGWKFSKKRVTAICT
jgi:hypothetical protein